MKHQQPSKVCTIPSTLSISCWSAGNTRPCRVHGTSSQCHLP